MAINIILDESKLESGEEATVVFVEIENDAEESIRIGESIPYGDLIKIRITADDILDAGGSSTQIDALDAKLEKAWKMLDKALVYLMPTSQVDIDVEIMLLTKIQEARLEWKNQKASPEEWEQWNKKANNYREMKVGDESKLKLMVKELMEQRDKAWAWLDELGFEGHHANQGDLTMAGLTNHRETLKPVDCYKLCKHWIRGQLESPFTIDRCEKGLPKGAINKTSDCNFFEPFDPNAISRFDVESC